MKTERINITASISEVVFLLVVLFCTLLPLCQVECNGDFYTENNVFLYNNIDNCKIGEEYFDVNFLKCNLCANNVVVGGAITNVSNLITSNDGLSCVCNKDSDTRILFDNILQQPICVNRHQKPPKCDNSTTKPANCSPTNSQMSVKSTCHLKKFNYTIYGASQIKKVQVFVDNGNCTCNAKTNTLYAKEFCIDNVLLKEYQNYQNFKSLSIYNDIRFVTFFCHLMKNFTACQKLSNLCVLSMYNIDKYSPCTLFFATQGTDGMGNAVATTNEFAWKLQPFLFFKKGRASAEMFEKSLDFQLDLDESNMQQNVINLTEISFLFEGKLTKFQSFNIFDLDFCSKPGSNGNALMFGQNFYAKCQIDVIRLLQKQTEPMDFKTIFINYHENGLNLLRAIPILMKSAFANNKNDDPLKWQLVKQFYKIDTLSGINYSYQAKKYQEDNVLEKYKWIRIVKSVELHFHLLDHVKNPNRITIPLLVLDYEEVNITQYKNSKTRPTVDFDFKVVFTKGHSFNFLFEILFPAFLILAFTAAVFQTFCFKTRQSKFYYDMEIFGHFLICLCSNIATTLLAIVLIVAIYTFIVYKTQKTVKILMPIEDQDAIVVFLYVAVAFKLVKLLHHLWQQITIDIFFIDWERPKLFDNFINGHRSSHLDTPSISSSVLTTKPCGNESVSAWRNYFMANEWLELTTKRKISMFCHVILMIVVFQVFGFTNWSTTSFNLHLHASSSNDEEKEKSKVLKIATGIIIYCSVYFLQRIYNVCFFERYVNNPIQQFIDLSSLANCSVFILSMDLFGYYIHGRSPHGFSDTDMCSMMIQLRREEENMCGHRGLLPGSEQQTYTILIPRNLRIFYDKLIAPMQMQQWQHRNSSISIFALPHQENNNGKPLEYFNFEKTLISHQSMNKFLSAFIDHTLRDLEYSIQEKNIIEIILDYEFQSYVTENKGCFYIDNGNSFTNCLFYGNEFLLFQFELLLFLVVVLLTDGFLTAILCVGLVYKTMEMSIYYLCKGNLSKKTLIDKRFLI